MLVASDTGKMSNDRVLPIHNISVPSIMTSHWITGFMWRVYKKGHATLDVMWKCCKEESARINGQRQDCSFRLLTQPAL